MSNRREHPGQGPANRPNNLDNTGHGPQGIDKAPGEEPSQDNVQFSQEALKGKKVDRDLTQQKDEPLDHQGL